MEAPPPTRPLPAWLRKGTNGQLSGWGARGHRGGGDRGGGGPVPDEDVQRVSGCAVDGAKRPGSRSGSGRRQGATAQGVVVVHQICAAATVDER